MALDKSQMHRFNLALQLTCPCALAMVKGRHAGLDVQGKVDGVSRMAKATPCASGMFDGGTS